MSIEPLFAVSVLLSAGIASVLFLPVIGISPIVGFLLAGVAFGQYGFDIVPQGEIIHLLAEMGVVFLMFDIGMHFSVKHVWSERKGIFVLGPGQVALSALGFYAGLEYFFDLPAQVDILLAITFALSSTAVVSQVLAERKMSGLPLARRTMAVLIFQDICAIFVLILASGMGEPGVSVGALFIAAALKCMVCVTVATLVGKYLLSPGFGFFARFNNSDAFTMIALLIVLATGMATQAFGLSLTLGAFLAGMIISESPFRAIIQTETKPFRNLLLGFFFVTVGMSVNVPALASAWGLTLGITLALVIVKSATVFALFMAAREGRVAAVQQALLLFQGSEFVFVILAQPALQGMIDPALKDSAVAAVAISMAISSGVFGLGKRVSRTLCRANATAEADAIAGNIAERPNAVIVIGMNDVTQTVASALGSQGTPYLVVEREYNKFTEALQNGFPVVYGDKADLRFWDSIQIDKYKTMVIASPDLGVSRVYAGLPRTQALELSRFLSVRSEEEAEPFRGLGYAKIFVAHGVPPGIEMAAAVMAHLGHAADVIADWMDKEQKDYLERTAAVAA